MWDSIPRRRIWQGGVSACWLGYDGWFGEEGEEEEPGYWAEEKAWACWERRVVISGTI